ncbi:hypothetical protein BDR22DRAFT_821197 [Usnea florida]
MHPLFTRPGQSTSLRTTNLSPPRTPLPSDWPSDSPVSASSSSTSLTPRFAAIRTTTSPASPSVPSSRPPYLRSESTPTSSPIPTFNPASNHLSTTDDSLWSASLSRYSFCSSNSQKSLSQTSSRSTSRSRSKKDKPRRKRPSSSSGTITRCGRHGDEWLFGGWTNMRIQQTHSASSEDQSQRGWTPRTDLKDEHNRLATESGMAGV